MSSWTDKKSIAAYSDSDPHRSTVRKLRPRMADSRFLIYEVRGKPDWAEDATAAAASSGTS